MLLNSIPLSPFLRHTLFIDLSVGDGVFYTQCNAVRVHAIVVRIAEDGLFRLEYYRDALKVVNGPCNIESIFFAILVQSRHLCGLTLRRQVLPKKPLIFHHWHPSHGPQHHLCPFMLKSNINDAEALTPATVPVGIGQGTPQGSKRLYRQPHGQPMGDNVQVGREQKGIPSLVMAFRILHEVLCRGKAACICLQRR